MYPVNLMHILDAIWGNPSEIKNITHFKLFDDGEGFQIMRFLLKQNMMLLMDNLVKVGNVEDTAITIEADHCKKL